MLAASVISAVTLASAIQNCAPRVLVVDRLKALFAEQHQFSLVAGNKLLEVWMNVDEGTWTVLSTDTQGVTCVLSAGRGVIANVVPENPGNDL